MGQKALLIDTTKCIGCGSCELICKQAHAFKADKYSNIVERSNLSNTASSWIVNRKIITESDDVTLDYFIKMCYHCESADCIKYCPENAIRRKDSFVFIDYNNCVSCGKCIDACPYNAVKKSNVNSENLKKTFPYKCDGCLSLSVDKPLCASVCPTEAIKYDYRKKIIIDANDRIKKMKNRYPDINIFGLFENRGLNVIQILKTKKNLKYISKKKPSTSSKELYSVLKHALPNFRSVRRKLIYILDKLV